MAVNPSNASSQFALQDLVSDRHHRLILAGELDITATATLEACLHEVCAHDTASLTIDLSQLTFMDSNGVRITLLARQLCQQHGCHFQLIAGPPQIQLLFEVTGLLNRLPFQPNSSQAAY
jgi:anti-anti-sigma factor